MVCGNFVAAVGGDFADFVAAVCGDFVVAVCGNFGDFAAAVWVLI